MAENDRRGKTMSTLPPRLKGAPAGIGVRILAACYDACILLGLAFLVFIPVTIVEQTMGAIPQWLKGMLLITIAWAYFVGFWTHGGATTGMRPWKLVVATTDEGGFPSWGAASFRFAGLMITWLALAMTAIYILFRETGHPLFFIAGIVPAASLACVMLTPRRQTLHDLLAGTTVWRVRDEDAAG
ncbi:MAG: RDD family protein [Mariprofundaceae bacterium]